MATRDAYDPYKVVGRPPYQEDPVYQSYFKDVLQAQDFSFDQTVEHVDIAATKEVLTGNTLSAMRERWLAAAKKWLATDEEHKHKAKDADPTLPAFAAITLFFTFFPFDLLSSEQVSTLFNQHYAKQFNILVFWEHQGYEPLPFEDHENLLDSGPSLPSIWERWFVKRYNEAAWWATYYLYEHRNGLPHLFDDVCKRARIA